MATVKRGDDRRGDSDARRDAIVAALLRDSGSFGGALPMSMPTDGGRRRRSDNFGDDGLEVFNEPMVYMKDFPGVAGMQPGDTSFTAPTMNDVFSGVPGFNDGKPSESVNETDTSMGEGNDTESQASIDSIMSGISEMALSDPGFGGMTTSNASMSSASPTTGGRGGFTADPNGDFSQGTPGSQAQAAGQAQSAGFNATGYGGYGSWGGGADAAIAGRSGGGFGFGGLSPNAGTPGSFAASPGNFGWGEGFNNTPGAVLTGRGGYLADFPGPPAAPPADVPVTPTLFPEGVPMPTSRPGNIPTDVPTPGRGRTATPSAPPGAPPGGVPGGWGGGDTVSFGGPGDTPGGYSGGPGNVGGFGSGYSGSSEMGNTQGAQGFTTGGFSSGAAQGFSTGFNAGFEAGAAAASGMGTGGAEGGGGLGGGGLGGGGGGNDPGGSPGGVG